MSESLPTFETNPHYLGGQGCSTRGLTVLLSWGVM